MLIATKSKHFVKNVQIWSFFLVCIFPYLVGIRENTDQKKLRIWTFSRSENNVENFSLVLTCFGGFI